jgi:hypothetical protein
MIASKAPVCLAVDCSTYLTDALVHSLANSAVDGEPVRGVGRYVGISHANPGDIDGPELDRITGAGLGCWLVQHVRATQGKGWTPSGQLGRLDGAMAAKLADAAGYSHGCHLACDLEDVAPGTDPQHVIDHVNAWADACSAMYLPMLYVGFSTLLSPQELFQELTLHAYWSDFGPRAVAQRGFRIKQFRENVNVGGVMCDLDRVAPDAFGDSLVWAMAS